MDLDWISFAMDLKFPMDLDLDSVTWSVVLSMASQHVNMSPGRVMLNVVETFWI